MQSRWEVSRAKKLPLTMIGFITVLIRVLSDGRIPSMQHIRKLGSGVSFR